MGLHITIDHARLSEVCRRHHISRLSFFGSVLRDDFDPNHSDIDVLVEFDRDAQQGLTYFKLAKLADELEQALGRRVDLSQPETLHPRLRDHILESAEMLYDAA